MERNSACALCGERAILKCSACENVYYCNKQHQKADWRKHAKACKLFKVAENSTLGRYYVATRNIKVGEIVLKDDEPLLAGPMQDSVPVCLGCYTVLCKSTAVPCTKCGWPLCHSCKRHGTECDFTSSRRSDMVQITEFGYPHPSYQCINVIRALSLKNTDIDSYKKVLSLESHSDTIKNKKNSIFEESSNLVRFIKRFFKSDDISEEEITKIIGVLQVNGHEVPLTDPPYVAIYELASLIEHNCKANCSKSFTDTGGLIIHATTPLLKGDHISICYTDPLWGTLNRRHHLSETKYFECTCDRCKDPTEFGVMFNAIKCNRTECTGYALPKTFLGDKRQDYVCATCRSASSYEKVEEILEEIGVYLSRMKKNNVNACKQFLCRYQNILHANHFHNIDVIIALAQLIGQQNGLEAIEENLLVEKIELCSKLGNILKTLAPAENRIRGLILFEMHAALAEFSRRHPEENTSVLLLVICRQLTASETIDLAGQKSFCKIAKHESKRCVTDAYELLKYEPKLLPEGNVATTAKKNLQQLNEILKRRNVKSKQSP